MTLPVVFAIVSALGAALTWNAYRPVFRSTRLSVLTFFAGWLVSELPIHHVVWQLAAAGLFIAAGALDAWPGWVGLAVALGSWLGLAYLVVDASRVDGLMERALLAGLGAEYRGLLPERGVDRLHRISLWRLARPFRMRHPEVELIRDIHYAPHGRRGMLDIYRRRPPEGGAPAFGSREGPARGFPVLLQIHGGAWVIGDKEHQGLALMNLLAARGWVCVAMNYRLSPRATFPDHLVDVKRALAWVKEHIAAYGGDPDFVVLTGGSAGGHLSALAALTPNAPEYQPGFEHADTTVRACVPFYGVYDFTNRTGAAHGGLQDLLERHVMKRRREEAPEAFAAASPMSRVMEAAPPFFVVHGTNDSLVPVAEARLFVSLLGARSRAPVLYAELPGAQHAFEVFLSLRAAHVLEAVARFLAVVHAAYAREEPRERENALPEHAAE